MVCHSENQREWYTFPRGDSQERKPREQPVTCTFTQFVWRDEVDYKIRRYSRSLVRLGLSRVPSTWKRRSVQKVLESTTIRKGLETLWSDEKISSCAARHGQTHTPAS
jgi:hypothetical protein